MPDCKIDIEFADGEYTFALPLPQIDELQQKTGIGIGGLFARVLKGCHRITNAEGEERVVQLPDRAEFYSADLVETIRLGLIGGNHATVNGKEIQVSAVLARQLIDRYVANKPLTDSWSLAASILSTCVMGFDPPKKDGAAEAPQQPPIQTAA